MISLSFQSLYTKGYRARSQHKSQITFTIFYIMSRRNQQHQSESQSEAEEVREEIKENSEPLSQEEEGEDLLEDPELDYQPIPELDQYENKGIDDQEYVINPEDRRAAEKKMNQRDFNQIEGDDLDDLLSQQAQIEQQRQKKRLEIYQLNFHEEYEDEEIDYIDAEEEVGSPQAWVATTSVRKYISRRMTQFIFNFRQKNKPIYYTALKNMCFNNHQSLAVDFNHLKDHSPKLTQWVSRYPLAVIPEYNSILYLIATKESRPYGQLFKECFFKINNLPVIDNLRTLSYNHLGYLIKIRGVVTSASLVFSQLWQIKYQCQNCGEIKGPFFPQNKNKINLGPCYSCHQLGPFRFATAKSIYRNYQTLQVQQSPSSVDPGRIPRGKQVIVLGDNVSLVKPGDEVEVIGVFSTRFERELNVRQGFPVFHTFIQANNIQLIDKIDFTTTLDEDQLCKIPKSPKFPQNLYESIAPSIYGHYSVKRAITLSLFGGVQKKNEKKLHRIRGDINLLMLGDPGLAKSQFLKSVQKVFPRTVYTTGKGASAVGLTASVIKDKMTNDWRLQAGALVLADKGVCLIDQFDKMSEHDRTSIHEAMEQQTISISKAGIVATLNARCSVLASANPNNGIYNQQINFKDNVQLSDPILSRFDVLCVLKDKPNREIDGHLADFVIDQHMNNHPYRLNFMSDRSQKEEEKGYVLNKDFVKQYIRYARQKIKPKMTAKTSQIISDVYLKLREFSVTAGGIDIVTRHLQSMIRLAQAHAKMHLRKETNDQDAKVAVSVMIRSFIDTQRISTASKIKAAFKYYLLQEDLPQKK